MRSKFKYAVAALLLSGTLAVGSPAIGDGDVLRAKDGGPWCC